MESIKITVTGASALVTQAPVVTSGTVGQPVEFTFDKGWEKLAKTAVFRCGNKTYPVCCVENAAVVPWEVLESPGLTLHIGVFGTDPETALQLPTVWACAGVVATGTVLPDTIPEAPTPQVYDQILATAQKAVQEVNCLRQEADSGAFKGEKGDKGDAGVVDFLVVGALPTENIQNAIYLVPTEQARENNLFAEYIHVDGVWERIGSASVQVDLSEYVKNTDLATLEKAGVVKINPAWGISIHGNGRIKIDKATEVKIRERTDNFCPIVPGNLDFALMTALTEPKNLTWSEEQKAAARQVLGIDSLLTALSDRLEKLEVTGN